MKMLSIYYVVNFRAYNPNKGKGHFAPAPSIPPARGGKKKLLPLDGEGRVGVD